MREQYELESKGKTQIGTKKVKCIKLIAISQVLDQLSSQYFQVPAETPCAVWDDRDRAAHSEFLSCFFSFVFFVVLFYQVFLYAKASLPEALLIFDFLLARAHTSLTLFVVVSFFLTLQPLKSAVSFFSLSFSPPRSPSRPLSFPFPFVLCLLSSFVSFLSSTIRSTIRNCQRAPPFFVSRQLSCRNSHSFTEYTPFFVLKLISSHVSTRTNSSFPPYSLPISIGDVNFTLACARTAPTMGPTK